jgi:hypothetical protein
MESDNGRGAELIAGVSPPWWSQLHCRTDALQLCPAGICFAPADAR